MNQKRAIGIDPDAKGFQCILLTEGIQKGESKHFTVSKDDLQKFVKWIQSLKDVIIAIEGSNGQSKPIEQALRTNKIIFYSFKASDVEKYRRAVIGENKDNDRDAEAVASLALSLEKQNRIAFYKRVWFPDEGLQLLTRNYARLTKNKTAEINNLWKLIRNGSPDFYLMLKDAKMAGKDGKISKMNNKSLLTLLYSKSDLSEWKNLSDKEIFEAMGGKNYRGINEIIIRIKKIAKAITHTDESIYELIKISAETILSIKKQRSAIEKQIARKAAKDLGIQNLTEIKGVSMITASTIIAEIIDIRRFLKNDNLASMAGFGRRKYSTGDKSKEKSAYNYNRRLKNIFITAAKNFVLYNPDHHLTGFYRNLRKTGMKKIEAYKRVARSLVRMFFKRLYSIVRVVDVIVSVDKIEGSMAIGKTRNTIVSSYIPPSRNITTKPKKGEYRSGKRKSFIKSA